MDMDVLLEVKNIYKSFGPTKALTDVSFQLKAGEVRGLIGENGSGKSTVSSIISGMQKADQGEMIYQGESYVPDNVINASQKGVCMIVQEQSTVENISVAANIFLGKEDLFSKKGLVDVRRMESEAGKALQKIGADHISPRELTKYLSFEERKLMEIARAFYINPKILIVDETTTALSRMGREILYKLMRSLCAGGGSVIFISHDIEEVIDKSDAVTVLRDGILTSTLEKQEFSEERIRNLMVGREIKDDYYRTDMECQFSDEVVLRAQQISCGILKDISFELHAGEILGMGGLTECGMHDLGKLLFGVIRPEKGRVLYKEKTEIRNPGMAIKNHIGYMSKNRDKEALMTASSIEDNICVSAYDFISKVFYIPRKKEKIFASKWAEEMNVKMHSTASNVSSLSGGNKQKVVLAKWMANETEIFIMDCPTRGIDVGVKAAIYRLMEKLKKEGKAILMISEELPELLGMSDRILIMKDGKLSGEFCRDDKFTEQILIGSMI